MLKVGDVVRATESIRCEDTILEGDIGVICSVDDADKEIPYRIQFFISRGNDDGSWWCEEEEIELVEDTTTC